MGCRTSIGLDVHARTVAAAAFVPETGEVVEGAFAYDPASIASWASSLPRPARAAYESGPTGFDLKRSLDSLGPLLRRRGEQDAQARRRAREDGPPRRGVPRLHARRRQRGGALLPDAGAGGRPGPGACARRRPRGPHGRALLMCNRKWSE